MYAIGAFFIKTFEVLHIDYCDNQIFGII